MKTETAQEIAVLAEEYAAELDTVLKALRAECTAEEFEMYADGIAQVLEHLNDDILAPIYAEHPALRPPRP